MLYVHTDNKRISAHKYNWLKPMPRQPIHTERHTQIISRHAITDHLSTCSGNKIYFRNIVRKWFYDSVKSITDLLSNLNVYYIPHAFSTR